MSPETVVVTTTNEAEPSIKLTVDMVVHNVAGVDRDAGLSLTVLAMLLVVVAGATAGPPT